MFEKRTEGDKNVIKKEMSNTFFWSNQARLQIFCKCINSFCHFQWLKLLDDFPLFKNKDKHTSITTCKIHIVWLSPSVPTMLPLLLMLQPHWPTWNFPPTMPLALQDFCICCPICLHNLSPSSLSSYILIPLVLSDHSSSIPSWEKLSLISPLICYHNTMHFSITALNI